MQGAATRCRLPCQLFYWFFRFLFSWDSKL